MWLTVILNVTNFAHWKKTQNFKNLKTLKTENQLFQNLLSQHPIFKAANLIMQKMPDSDDNYTSDLQH